MPRRHYHSLPEVCQAKSDLNPLAATRIEFHQAGGGNKNDLPNARCTALRMRTGFS
jgi:hypothetical protein